MFDRTMKQTIHTLTFPNGFTKQKYIRALCWNVKSDEVKCVGTKLSCKKYWKDIRVGHIQMVQCFKYWFVGSVVGVEYYATVEDMLCFHLHHDIIPFSLNDTDVVKEFNKFYRGKSEQFCIVKYKILEFKLGDEYPHSIVCGRCRIPRPYNAVTFLRKYIQCKKCKTAWLYNDCMDINKLNECYSCK